jgi:hypothetical protein
MSYRSVSVRSRAAVPALVRVTAALVAAGCGSGDDSPPAVDAAPPAPDAAVDVPDAAPPAVPLRIEGAMVVDNRANTEAVANQRVFIELRITRDGEPVTDAIVRINPAPPSFQTFLTGDPLDPSLYTGNYMGYHNNTARVEVGSGGGQVAEIAETVMIGVSLFRIDAPAAGTVVPAGADLDVSWSRPGGAADALVVTTEGGYDSGPLADAAEHTVPGTSIPGSDTGAEAVVVLRSKRNALPGAADGSFIDFGVASRVAFEVDPGAPSDPDGGPTDPAPDAGPR